MHYRSDIAIIGGGLAGLITAYELLDTGRKIIIFDRDNEDNLGGLAKKSFGGIFFVNTAHQRRLNIKDNADLALSDWMSFAEFGEEDAWPKKWAEHYVSNCTDMVYTWLQKEIGIGFFPVVHWVERGLQKKGNSVPRFHMVWGTGYELIKKIVQKIRKHPQAGNLEFFFGHKVTDLIMNSQQVTGFRGINENSGQNFTAEATHIVISSGGLAGNISSVKANWYKPWGDPPEFLLNGSHRYAQGDLHQAVKEIRGNVTHTDLLWNYAAGVHHPNPEIKDHGLSIVPPRSALWMNYKGERIGPSPLISGFDTRYLVQKICEQEKKYSWQIMNWRIARKELAVSGSEFNDAIKNKNLIGFVATLLFGNKKLLNALNTRSADFIIANSIEELAGKMNELNVDKVVNAELLKKNIMDYDKEVAKGKGLSSDEQLMKIELVRKYRGDRIRISKNQTIMDKKALPLVAIREFILTRKSLGGIQTDLHCRVLNEDGNHIRGLFAVGEAAGFGGGGIHGKRSLEGTFLGNCVLNGRLAAKAIRE